MFNLYVYCLPSFNEFFFYFSGSQSQAGLAGSIAGGKSAGGQSTSAVRECPLCMAECTLDQFPILRNCPHLFCMDCLHTYTKLEIHEGRVNLKCPQCNELIHPNGKEFCLKLSELVQTCLELFKLVQTCPNKSKLIFSFMEKFIWAYAMHNASEFEYFHYLAFCLLKTE